MAIRIGHGDGTFDPYTTLATDAYPYRFALGRLNSDASPDLAVANFVPNGGSATAQSFLGNGAGGSAREPG